jgi:signal transduction histidine kinase
MKTPARSIIQIVDERWHHSHTSDTADADDWKFQRLLELLPAAAYTCDAQGLITSFNLQAVKLWGRAPRLNDPAERFCGAYKLVDTDGTPIPHDRSWMALALESDREYEGCEIIIERHDGTRRSALAHANPLHDPNGTLVGAVNVLVDLTDLRLVEQGLREANSRKDDFLAILAHELRNPLAPLRNALHLLSLDNGSTATRAQAHSMMERQLGQMVLLVDCLMDAARIARGNLTIQKERIDIITVIHSAVEDTRPMIEEYGHALTVTLPDGPVYVEGDPIRLAQVFSNLLRNAAKYTPKGGDIWVAGRQREEEIIVEVHDNGVGIPAEMLDRIFDPFTQIDHPGGRVSQGGLGIGLSLVKGMLEMHDGGVDVHSDGPGRGSMFVAVLPTLPESQQAVPASVPRIRRIPGIGSRRILVVEDNADSAASLALMLQYMGHETRTAPDGVAALAIAAEFLPQVILLDIGLPKLSGYDAAQLIREQPWGQGIFMIALTGWGHDEARRRAAAAGFDLHMVKPVEPASLENLLAGLQRVRS